MKTNIKMFCGNIQEISGSMHTYLRSMEDKIEIRNFHVVSNVVENVIVYTIFLEYIEIETDTQ